MKDEKLALKLKVNWDVENSALLTKKIYEIVETHHIKATIKAKASELELSIQIVSLAVAVYQIFKEIDAFIKKHREKEKLPPVKSRILRKIVIEETVDEYES